MEAHIPLTDFGVERVTGDKAYLSRKNAQAVEDAGAVPFVPFKSTRPSAESFATTSAS